VSTRFQPKPIQAKASPGRSYVYALPAAEKVCADVWKLNGTWRKGFWSYKKFEASLVKAKLSGYSRFVLSELVFQQANFAAFIQDIRAAGLTPVLQVSSDDGLTQWNTFITKNSIVIERWITDRWPDWNFLRTISTTNEVSLKIVGLRNNSCLYDLDRIPDDFCAGTEFYFPYFLDKKRKLRPKEVMAWCEYVQKNHPRFSVRGLSGADIYEPRITEDLELEPCHGPLVCSHPLLQPKVSVVIPTYNNSLYLLNTLRHLEQQRLDKNQYEVVVVDDGSCDKMSEGIVELLKGFKMPVRLLYYPRMKPRKMGDNQFRAGLARNYGVKFARGELLVFLDSDIFNTA
jgi:hypothetical protein